jgi:hypothetical protein
VEKEAFLQKAGKSKEEENYFFFFSILTPKNNDYNTSGPCSKKKKTVTAGRMMRMATQTTVMQTTGYLHLCSNLIPQVIRCPQQPENSARSEGSENSASCLPSRGKREPCVSSSFDAEY